MSDPREPFVRAIDLSNARVETFPGLIFFCGGPLGDSGPPRSLRDFVYRWLRANDADMASRIVIAEQINNWMKDGIFEELFTLEQRLAALASVIVIFLESPGSIAELGAFSALTGVQDKLLVFVREEHFHADSFIRLGPVDFLKKRDDRSVVVYPWGVLRDSDGERLDEASAEECIGEIYSDLRHATARTSRAVNPTSDRDRMLLIADLVGYLLALKSGEIKDYLASLGINLSQGELGQYLFVLEKLGLIGVVTRGNNRYYIARKEGLYLRLAFAPDHGPYDRLRLNVDVANFYGEHDPTRRKAVSKALAGLS